MRKIILQVAAVDYDLMPPGLRIKHRARFRQNKHNPSREFYTKADVVKLMQQAVAEGAN